MHWKLIGLILVGVFSISRFALAEMTSTNYQIEWDSINSGGSDVSSSGSYVLRDTVGNASAGESESTSYLLQAGYRAGIFDQVISFDIFGQNSSSSRTATALIGTTITTDVTGLSIGDYIALIQDEGENQISAIGQITEIGAGTITVDELKDGGVSPTIDGTNDFVYQLEGNDVGLGTLNTASVKTATIGFEINSGFDPGYSVQVYENQGLIAGTKEIDPVADGVVTVGSEEYGGRSSDRTLGSTFDTIDTAFMTDFQEIADDIGVQIARRNFLTLKAAIASSTDSGDYSQTLTIIASGNF
ncbi:MAG: hypothetical protein V1664_03480 [Candidatus Uhrbacteria bacterium]